MSKERNAVESRSLFLRVVRNHLMFSCKPGLGETPTQSARISGDKADSRHGFWRTELDKSHAPAAALSVSNFLFILT
jgi:hypothetical protein